MVEDTRHIVRERSEREIVSDMWTKFFERKHPEVGPEIILALVDRVLDLVTNIEDFNEQDAKFKEVYREFGVEVRNNETRLDQV